jgi:hypothetical protein
MNVYLRKDKKSRETLAAEEQFIIPSVFDDAVDAIVAPFPGLHA